MKTKLIFEVEKGTTKCGSTTCPFFGVNISCKEINCENYNLMTLKLLKVEDEKDS